MVPPLIMYSTPITEDAPPSGDNLAPNGGLDLSELSSFQPVLDVDGSCPPVDYFDHNMIFTFNDMAAHSLMSGLPPMLHLDQPLSESSPSSVYPDTVLMDPITPYPGFPQVIMGLQYDVNRIEQAMAKPSKFVFTEEMRQNLLKEIRTLSIDFMEGVKLPSAKIIEATIRSYIDCFDPHLPIIHLPTIVSEGVPTPLLLSMCAIGSLYRLERKVAADFYHLADDLMRRTEAVQSKPRVRRLSAVFSTTASTSGVFPAEDRPIWTVQCRLLLSFFALFVWDGTLAQSALDEFTTLSQEFRRRALPLQRAQALDRRLSWQSWVQAESVKRTLCGILIVDSLSAVTYGSVPGSYYEEAEMDVPDDDRLWRCPTATSWRHQIDSQAANPPLRLEQLLAHIIKENEPENQMGCNWSSSLFAVVVAMHAININVLHIALAVQALQVLPLNQQESMRNKFWTDMDVVTDAFRKAFTAGDRDADPWQDPLLFNCLAVLRIAFMRECTDSIKSFNRRVLLGCNTAAVEQEIQAYVLGPPFRGPRVTEAVSKSFSAMLLPMRTGAMLVRKTAALTWSIEHAVAWWDTALFFTRWTYSIECLKREGKSIDPEEEDILEKISKFLESDTDETAEPPLAARVAREWASFMDDTWVWGVTPRMGWVLREFAKFYERHFNELGMRGS